MSSWYEDYMAAWGGGDAEALAAWFSDDVVYEDTTIGHQASGIEAMRGFIAGSFAKMPDVSFDVVAAVDADEGFSIEWVMQPMGIRGLSIGERRGDKIVAQRDYWDGRAFG